jgi:hypothetical protein
MKLIDEPASEHTVGVPEESDTGKPEVATAETT